MQRQTLYGQYERLMGELELEDPAVSKNFVRVEPAIFRELLNRLGLAISKKDTFYRKALHPAIFRELLNRLGPAISKKDTFYRKALHPGLRLAITLRFLATGDIYH